MVPPRGPARTCRLPVVAARPLLPGAVDLAPAEVNRSGRPALPYSHAAFRFAKPMSRGRSLSARGDNAGSVCAFPPMIDAGPARGSYVVRTDRLCNALHHCPTFPEFYSAINGRAPFPWQSRLAD